MLMAIIFVILRLGFGHHHAGVLIGSRFGSGWAVIVRRCARRMRVRFGRGRLVHLHARVIDSRLVMRGRVLWVGMRRGLFHLHVAVLIGRGIRVVIFNAFWMLMRLGLSATMRVPAAGFHQCLVLLRV